MRRSPLQRIKKEGRRGAAPRAWIAERCANEDGYQLGPKDRPALSIYAVSVRDSLSVAIDERLRLMDDVAARFAQRVPPGVSSLWVFLGGYFGFSAVRGEWQHLDVQARRLLEREFIDRAHHFLAPSLIAVGVDSRSRAYGDVTQQVWVAQRHRNGVSVSKVTRGESQLAVRQFIAGSTKAAFFVCGEFTGSETEQNCPFHIENNERECFLKDPARQLRGCGILVDLAHDKVSGSI
jgi:hypothetical protein